MSLGDKGDAATRQRIDAICDAFEKSWRGGQNPRVEEHLVAIEPAARPALLRELLLVEWELLEEQGVTVEGAVYARRFAE